MSVSLDMKWNLERLYEGGSRSPRLEDHLAGLEAALPDLVERAGALPDPAAPGGADLWAGIIGEFQEVVKRFGQARSFVGCLTAQDVHDQPAKRLEGRVNQLFAQVEAVTNTLEAKMLQVSDPDWKRLLTHPKLEPISFVLNERRSLAAAKLGREQELLASDLAVSGYHAWSSLYDTIIGQITIPFEEDGEVKQLSVGQAYTKFQQPGNEMRARLFASWEQAFREREDLFAATLNNIAGFRLSLYRHRGWEDVLREPLDVNRMRPETLEAMWSAVVSGQERMSQFLRRKARLLGKERLDWADLAAPLGASKRKISYGQGAAFIEEQFRRFSPSMANFASRAFRERWIEAEDRPGKMPGGFCTDFPESGESRIFMTYSDDIGSVSVLAHELGHAFHSDAVFDQDPFNQNYAMNVAETASTLAELVIMDAAIQQATSEEERLARLDEKLNSAASYLMNIHARFLFETRFYAARAKGQLSVEELDGLMVEAQRESYRDSLGTYHPLFWASKGHFYFTGAPFYNFPYTFGYLFSAGVYAASRGEGAGFEERYRALLRDTGRMTVEELAHRHLGADLTKPEFWMTGVRLALDDVDLFLRLTEGR